MMMPHVQQEGMRKFITGMKGVLGSSGPDPKLVQKCLGEQGKETGSGFCGN